MDKVRPESQSEHTIRRIQNDPKPGKNRNSGRPLFPKRLLPVFSLLFAVLGRFGENRLQGVSAQ
jgi:hypothetical protein